QRGQYRATLILENKKVLAHVHDFESRNVELAGQITLAQALVSADKMDWIIEKAVELGVHAFIPIAAQRSVVSLGAERLNKKIRHWEKVIESASAQCGRNQLMHLGNPQTLAALLATEESRPGNTTGLSPCAEPGPNLTLVSHPNAQNTLRDVLTSSSNRITLLVGPEGGWSDEELKRVAQCNVQPVSFGKRILRTETAGLAMVSAISALQHWE
ncbi:MAG: 16S rRNA (uracil(1498)-N(3))-methyltransferase, partial [Pusillimonas sp.]|nr:16S rRNA (uracil(1498)-N(3))-methyltransferase [Pusillimonas sp.]